MFMYSLLAIRLPLLALFITSLASGAALVHGHFLVALVVLPLVLLSILDLRARFRDFLALTKKLKISAPAWSPLSAKFSRSACSRDVFCSAIGLEYGHAGYELERISYHHAGYRWYHLLPDGFPFVLFHQSFWRSFL